MLIHLQIIYSSFALQWQSWVVATETKWSANLKYLLSDPLQKKFVDP